MTILGASEQQSSLEARLQELKQTEFFLSEGQRLSHAGSWAFNRGGFDYWSPELFHIHGLDPSSKPPTTNEYLSLVHPEDREFSSSGWPVEEPITAAIRPSRTRMKSVPA